MDRGTRVFWLLLACLLGASVFFGVSAESRRRAVQRSEAKLDTGDIVRLARVVDGDTILVENDQKQDIAVRILGIKAFEDHPARDSASRFGAGAEQAMKRIMQDKPVRVLLNNPPQDKHGRTLAELFVGGKNVGLELVRRGLVMVYTVYPFPSMSLYLQAQEAARAERRGLWGDDAVAKRADLLGRQWQLEAK